MSISKDSNEIIKRFIEKISIRFLPINSKNGIIDYTIISKIDYDSVKNKTFRLKKYINKEYVQTSINNYPVLLHHIIMGNNKDRNTVIDHIDGNSFNNRRYNLRLVSISYNNQNRNINKSLTTSKYIGVSLEKNIWRSQMSKMKLGSFKNEIEAAIQYDKASYILYGKNAKNNKLIDYLDIKDLSIEDILPIKRELPSNICIENNKYNVEKTYKRKKYRFGAINTLSEALLKLNKINEEIERIKENDKKIHYNKEIIRNIDGLAIINIKDREVIVDDDIWHKLTLNSWADSLGYVRGVINKKNIFIHHYILNVNRESLNGNVVDHINGNKYDNRICNLKIRTQSNNSQNKPKRNNCSSIFIGVSIVYKNKYKGSISFNKKRYALGQYECEYLAAISYNILAIKFHGEYAKINDIPIQYYNNSIIVYNKLLKKNFIDYNEYNKIIQILLQK